MVVKRYFRSRNLTKALEGKPASFNKFLNIIKLVLLAGTFGFIFYKLFYAYHLDELYQGYELDLSVRNLFILFTALLLTAVNWGLETLKWKWLIAKEEQMTTLEATRAVLSGVTLSMITPNQIGDFAGRVIHLKKLNKLKGSLVTVIGHTAQMMMTIAFGLFAFAGFLESQNQIQPGTAKLMYILVGVLILAGIPAYLHIDKLSRLPFGEKISNYLQVFKGYSKSVLMAVWSVSFLRYLIFLIQYALLLEFYNLDTTLVQSMVCVAASLFVQSFVPSFILLDIGIRGASALFFFGYFTGMQTQVLMTVYTLWIFNFLLPGLAGLYFIMKWKWNT